MNGAQTSTAHQFPAPQVMQAPAALIPRWHAGAVGVAGTYGFRPAAGLFLIATARCNVH